MRIFCAVAAACVLANCTKIEPLREFTDVPVLFEPGDAAFVLKNGTATVTGRIYSGHIQGVRAQVKLIPVTDYSIEQMDTLFVGKKVHYQTDPGEIVDPRYGQHMRVTTADHIGRYSFDHVAAGSFYIYAVVPEGEEAGEFAHMETVRVKPGQRHEVNLDGY